MRNHLLRFLPACGTLFLFTFAFAAPAQDAQEGEDNWRDLLTGAQRAAGAGRYADAEQAYLKALHEAERYGPDDWRVGTTLQSLGETYRTEKKISEAEAALRRALPIVEMYNDDDSAEVASVYYDIGAVLLDSGHATDALIQARRALAGYQGKLGGSSPEAGAALCLVGDSLRTLKDFIDAEDALQRCAGIREAANGIDSVELADAVYSLALAYVGEKKYHEAEPRFSLAERIREKKLGITSPLLAQTMEDHATLLRILGRDQEAERLTKFAAAIRHSGKKQP